MPVGALIGTECVTSDGLTVGTVIYLDRDREGRPRWIDVGLADEVRQDHGIEPDRLRFPAGLIAERGADTVRLDVDLEGLRARSSPSQPVEIEEPVL